MVTICYATEVRRAHTIRALILLEGVNPFSHEPFRFGKQKSVGQKGVIGAVGGDGRGQINSRKVHLWLTQQRGEGLLAYLQAGRAKPEKHSYQ